MTVRVYDFFAGCGGASCGFYDAGMKISYAMDNNLDAQTTFTSNFPDVYFENIDIREVNIGAIQHFMASDKPHPILFTGCAPCQPFTRQNTQRPESGQDERVQLLSHFAVLVDSCLPDLVFIENVPGLQNFDQKSQPFGNLLDQLDAAGYSMDYRVVRMARYGIPQSRRRLILIASRYGAIRLPNETHGPGTSNPQYSTVRDWIYRLPEIRAGEEHREIPNHMAARISERNLERIKATPEGGDRRDWPEYLKLDCHKKISGYTDTYGRMLWDAPASTLTTRCISYSNGRFGHPVQNRAISIREAARLQTFPDRFEFFGSVASMAKQIGNAVPVLLAKLIGKQFIDHLKSVGRLP